jgi:predicted porin
MNKKLKRGATALLAAAAALGAAPSLAQVTLSGFVDVNIDIAKSGGATTRSMGSGGLNTSRLQFKSVEDLGGGLKATAVHEFTFRADNGQPGSPRHTYVALASKDWGEISAGRRDLPSAEMYGYIDPTFSGDYSPISNTLLYYAPWRESNGLFYTSPRLANMQARLGTTFGREDGSKDAKATSIGLDYWGKDLYVMAATDQQYRRDLNNATQIRRSRDHYLGAVYSMGALDLTFLYHRYSGYYAYPPYADFSSKGSDVQVGMRYEFNAHQRIFASVVRKNDQRDAALSDATSWVVGYLHGLSKRTDIYTIVGAVKHARDSDMRFPVSFNHATPASNENPRGVQIGIRHKF